MSECEFASSLLWTRQTWTCTSIEHVKSRITSNHHCQRPAIDAPVGHVVPRCPSQRRWRRALCAVEIISPQESPSRWRNSVSLRVHSCVVRATAVSDDEAQNKTNPKTVRHNPSTSPATLGRTHQIGLRHDSCNAIIFERGSAGMDSARPQAHTLEQHHNTSTIFFVLLRFV